MSLDNIHGNCSQFRIENLAIFISVWLFLSLLDMFINLCTLLILYADKRTAEQSFILPTSDCLIEA